MICRYPPPAWPDDLDQREAVYDDEPFDDAPPLAAPLLWFFAGIVLDFFAGLALAALAIVGAIWLIGGMR